MFLVSLLGILFFVYATNGKDFEECGLPRRRQCRHAILEGLDNQKRALSTHELEFHCKSLRDNMECLIWQLSECQTSETQEGNTDIIWRVWKYMRVVCNAFDDWRNKKCFISDNAKACEKHMHKADIKNKKPSCEDYETFRDCIIDVVETKCSDDESSYFGSYLLDTAGSMVWMCPKPEELGASSQGGSGGGGNGLVAEGSLVHAYRSSPLTGDSPFVTGCNARANEEMRGCLDRHQYERDQALGARDGEDRLRKTCCASWNYRRCVQNAVRVHCYDSREIDIQAANDVVPHDRDFLCREHWVYTCTNSVPSMDASSPILWLLVLIACCLTHLSC